MLRGIKFLHCPQKTTRTDPGEHVSQDATLQKTSPVNASTQQHAVNDKSVMLYKHSRRYRVCTSSCCSVDIDLFCWFTIV